MGRVWAALLKDRSFGFQLIDFQCWFLRKKAKSYIKDYMEVVIKLKN